MFAFMGEIYGIFWENGEHWQLAHFSEDASTLGQQIGFTSKNFLLCGQACTSTPSFLEEPQGN